MSDIMPIQPVKDGRFVKNRIVEYLLDNGPFDMNHLASLFKFTDQEQMQFAQLIGYSVGGFGDLSYVDDETYAAATRDSEQSEAEARNEHLRDTIKKIKEGIKISASAAFEIHIDDLDDMGR